jgi:hypothetical protein
LFHGNAIHSLGLNTEKPPLAQAVSNPPLAQEQHTAPPVFVDTSQPVPTPTTRGQPLIWSVTIDDAMPFHAHISIDAEVSLMSL